MRNPYSLPSGTIYGIVVGYDLNSRNIFIAWYQYGSGKAKCKKIERIDHSWVDTRMVRSIWSYSEKDKKEWEKHPHWPFIIDTFVLPLRPFETLKTAPWKVAKYNPVQGGYYTKIMPYPSGEDVTEDLSK